VTPKEKQRVLSMMPAHEMGQGHSRWAVPVHKNQILASANRDKGLVVLSLMVAIDQDNRRHSRAKKLAEKCSRSFFSAPRFVCKTVVHWDGQVYPVFYYRERGLL